MELLIDDANLQEIERILDLYPVEGVTTNPSILAKYPISPSKLLKELRALLGEQQLHVQVLADSAEGIIQDAHAIVKNLGQEHTYVKIPAVPEGFKAMKQLHQEGILITATAIYTPLQGYLAAKSGASYVAPYVNRIDNMGYNGVYVAQKIHDLLTVHNLPTKVLAASFKNSQQFLELCTYGIKAATLAPTIFDNMVKNPAIDAAIEVFQKEFRHAHGTDVNMADLFN